MALWSNLVADRTVDTLSIVRSTLYPNPPHPRLPWVHAAVRSDLHPTPPHPAPLGFMLLLFIVKTPLQVAPSWPLHTNEPVKQYKPVDIPDYTVDFTTYQPMEPQVSLHPSNQLTISAPQQCTPPDYPTVAPHQVPCQCFLSSVPHQCALPHECTPPVCPTMTSFHLSRLTSMTPLMPL